MDTDGAISNRVQHVRGSTGSIGPELLIVSTQYHRKSVSSVSMMSRLRGRGVAMWKQSR